MHDERNSAVNSNKTNEMKRLRIFKFVCWE